ncbi:MAG: hypothetical protein ACKVOH_00865 [Chlamydiales bacterium]
MSEYAEMFKLVDPWIGKILEAVKKDLKQEHLKKDREFCKRYFLGKNFNLVGVEEMIPAYRKEIMGGNTGLGEFIASRWLLKNSDVYDFFESELSRITPDFEKLEMLEEKIALQLKRESLAQFGATKTYLFSVLNAVTFSPDIFAELREKALHETEQRDEKESAQKEVESLEALQKRHQREVSSLTNRFDKKLSGMQKKYLKDTENLKKQISMLTQKINHL